MIFSISPASQNIIYVIGSGLVQIGSVTLTGQPGTPVNIDIQFQNTSVQWLYVGFSGFTGSTATAQIFISDADSLPGTNYTAKIFFTDENNFPFVHTVNISRQDPIPLIKTEKSNYNVVYNRISNTLSGDTTVNILNNNASETLTFEAIPTLFLTKTAVSSFTLEEDPAYPFATNAELPISGTKLITRRLKKSNGSIVTSFTITINVINSNDITAEPAFLNFTQYRHLSETKSAPLKLINPANENFSVSAPSFISVNPISGNSTVDLTVTTEQSDVLNAQTYTGEIEIAYASKVLKVPVTVNNVDFIDLPIAEYQFCLDDFILTVQRINDTGKFVKITLEIEIEHSEGLVSVSPSYQIAYFNEKASTDVGRKVHHYFPLFSKQIFENPGIEFNNIFVYKPANVNIIIEELNADYEVIFTKTTENIKLYPGKKPKMFPIFSNSSIKRIYADSAHSFSYLTTLVDPSDIVEKTVSTNPFGTGEVNAVYFEDSENLMDFGDFKNVLGIDFIRFPKGHEQVYLQFINHNLVPELAVFNGFYEINDDYTYTYDDIEFNARKYDTESIKKITLNTGFLLKEQSVMVDEICKSNLSFLKADNEIYRTLPLTAKIKSVSKSENLMNFELEFLIVKNTYGN